MPPVVRFLIEYHESKNADMKCPNCDEVLVMTERQGVEIDYCPRCRGVWLDKGELDKIIERATIESPAQQALGALWQAETVAPASRGSSRSRPRFSVTPGALASRRS